MIVTLRPAFLLALLAVVLYISFAEASPGKPRTSPTPCSTSVHPSSCTPTAVQTKPATLTFPEYPSGPPGDGTDLVFGTDWLFVACSVYYSNSCSGPSCDPQCCNKGLCGTSATTNLLLDYPSSNPPDFSIIPRSPATAFTIFTLTFTAGNDFQVYSSITVEITGTPITPYSSPVVKTVTIPKPAYGQYYSSVTVNLVSLGLGDVAKLNFRVFYTGSTAPGGGPVYAEVRVDGDGNGGGINFEAYTPLGCEKYHKRDDISISPMVVMKRTLEGNEFAL